MEPLTPQKSELEQIQARITDLVAHRDVDRLTDELADLTLQMGSDGFWDAVEKAQTVARRHSEVEGILNDCKALQGAATDLGEMIELVEADGGADEVAELTAELTTLGQTVADRQIELLLSGEADDRAAIVTIHPGAGGTESADWAGMLHRMYLRWADANAYTVHAIDFQPGDEAGIKSVTFQVVGPHAYGYLKAEAGVHRLVRISPFDAAKRRHTSFASIYVAPEAPDDVEIEIDDKDLRVDVFRASGAGGQHVNKTSSAVRLTHQPSGIVVQCQNERSQHQNRAQAMKVLSARLYERELSRRDAEMDALVGEKLDNAWGSQIRSYVFHPYQMVKDHRTNHETGNLSSVMDGDVFPFIRAYLLHRMAQAAQAAS